MQALGTMIYAACVDFMIRSANLLGITYRDTNGAMFFIVWPAVTVLLVLIVAVQRVAIWRLRSAK